MTFRNARLALELAVAAVLSLSCGGGGGGGGGGPTDSFNRQALLTHIAADLALPAYQDFLVKAVALRDACDAYAAEVLLVPPGPNVASLQATAQTAWSAAMLSWQVAELFQFGPAGASTVYKGGQDRRDEIYCFPFTNACKVDQEIAANTFTAPGFFDTTTVNAGGLAAVEYLLFHGGPSDSCSTPPVGWGGLSQDDKDKRRADYAKRAAADIVLQAQALIAAWSPAGGDFLGKFNNAAGSGVYSSAHDAVNEVFGAMFYLDNYTKDSKISHPAGINDGTADVEIVESPFANTSIAQLKKNLETFEIIFLGNRPGDPAGIGFDDFLIARGGTALAATLTADIAASRIALNNITGATLKDAISNIPAGSNATVLAAHAAVKKVTDNLKSQFVTILNLSVPQSGAGDND